MLINGAQQQVSRAAGAAAMAMALRYFSSRAMGMMFSTAHILDDLTTRSYMPFRAGPRAYYDILTGDYDTA